MEKGGKKEKKEKQITPFCCADGKRISVGPAVCLFMLQTAPEADKHLEPIEFR